MRLTIFDQFLAGSEFASALIYLAMGCLVGWNTFGTAMMIRLVQVKEVSAVGPALLTALSSMFLVLFAIAGMGFVLVNKDPTISILDFLLLLVPAIFVPMYCWRIEAK